jgi:hypothetical protein
MLSASVFSGKVGTSRILLLTFQLLSLISYYVMQPSLFISDAKTVVQGKLHAVCLVPQFLLVDTPEDGLLDRNMLCIKRDNI